MVCCSMRAISLGIRHSLSGLFSCAVPHHGWCMHRPQNCDSSRLSCRNPAKRRKVAVPALPLRKSDRCVLQSLKFLHCCRCLPATSAAHFTALSAMGDNAR